MNEKQLLRAGISNKQGSATLKGWFNPPGSAKYFFHKKAELQHMLRTECTGFSLIECPIAYPSKSFSVKATKYSPISVSRIALSTGMRVSGFVSGFDISFKEYSKFIKTSALSFFRRGFFIKLIKLIPQSDAFNLHIVSVKMPVKGWEFPKETKIINT